MSGDIHRVGTATHYMVQFAATLVIIGAQIVIAFLLAPLLTVVALILIAIGAGVGFVMLRRAHDFGARLSRMGIELMRQTSRFFFSGLTTRRRAKLPSPISSPNFRRVVSTEEMTQ